jgi:8-oxo-dGTP pyrophosphatase MutT (NUDIX family)
MHAAATSAEQDPAAIFRPDVTVATLVARDGRLLVVEESVRGQRVLNQPAGHLEPGESLVQAAARETLEETGWSVRLLHFVGAWLWDEPGQARTWLRFVFAAEALSHDPSQPLDAGILATHWLTPSELRQSRLPLRTPLVLSGLDAWLAGQRLPLAAVQYL